MTMSLFFLDSLNVLGLRSEPRPTRLDLGVDLCAVQETIFHSGDHGDIVTKTFDLFSAYYVGRSR